MGTGMKMLAKMYGGINFNINGKKTKFAYDYDKDESVEKAKRERIKEEKKQFKENDSKLF